MDFCEIWMDKLLLKAERIFGKITGKYRRRRQFSSEFIRKKWKMQLTFIKLVKGLKQNDFMNNFHVVGQCGGFF